jgi:group I intron endonuclease
MIYLITNTIDGKRYIGKTSRSIEQRWYEHCKNAEYGHDTYLYRAIRKYGKDAFTIELLTYGLDEEEIQLIAEHKPEYNMTTGGDGGNTSSSPNYVTAMARRSYVGELNPNYGKRGTNSPNHGKKRTQEQKDRIANSDYLRTKRRPVMIDGVYYESVLKAARALGRSERYVRLHDEYKQLCSDRIPLDGKIQAQDYRGNYPHC